jgi:hypothetical protein
LKEEEQKAGKPSPEDEEEMKGKKKSGKPTEKEDEEDNEEEMKGKKKAGKPDPEDEEACKAMNPAAVAGMLRGLKGAPKEIKAVIEWLDSKKTGKPEEEDKYPSPKGTTKSIDGAAVVIMDDGSVHVAGQQVTKSRKFTEGRTNTVKEVVTQLVNLLNEVDEEAAKAVLASFKELPAGKAPLSEVRPTGTAGTTKGIEDLLTDISKRLETIEKARVPSKSVADDGGTDGEKEVKKSLWSGVL